jgi:hypothetical protein
MDFQEIDVFNISNQIKVVVFQPVQLAQGTGIKKSNIAEWFFDICNAEMAVLPKIGHHLSYQKMYFTKKCISQKLYFTKNAVLN